MGGVFENPCTEVSVEGVVRNRCGCAKLEEIDVISFCGVGVWGQVIGMACCCYFILRDDWD